MELIKNFHWYADGSRQDMVVDNAKVVWRGPSGTGPVAQFETDLNGQTIAPGFVENHCHVIASGFDLTRLNLSGLNSHAEVLDAIRDRHRSDPDGWLLAVQYDQNRYAEGPIHARQLDLISETRPILLRHFNGHASVANSAALREAGITPSTPDPDGGTFGRDSDGSLNGTLLEDAHEVVWNAVPAPRHEDVVEAILAAGQSMANFGITVACDMQTGRPDAVAELEAYTEALKRGCAVDLRLMIQWRCLFGSRANPALLRERIMEFEATGRGRILGVKIFVDGAIGSLTAAIYGAYEGHSMQHDGWSGQLMYSPERFHEMVQRADAAGYQVAVHAIGDYAADLAMAAFEATENSARHRIEHIMIMSDAQLDRLARTGCHATMQPEFLHRFGHAYQRNLGPERTQKLKRFRAAIDCGIPLSFSSDRPIVPGDPRDAIRTATNRPEGFDPNENISMAEAVRAHTRVAAECMSDQERFGTLEPGSDARYVVLEG
jgi:predicted amidohydrolase YtcJ